MDGREQGAQCLAGHCPRCRKYVILIFTAFIRFIFWEEFPMIGWGK